MIGFEKTVLLVEDFRITRELEIKLLQEIGFTKVLPVENGREAIRKLMRNPDIGLIISDWNMPEKNGYELLKWVREHPQYKDIPFIMATAHGEQNQVKKALAFEVNGFLTKPFTARELKNTIETALGNAPVPETSFERSEKKTASGKTRLRAAHIQITDHLVLGVLDHLIRQKEIVPRYFELETCCMDGWNPVRDALADGSVDIAFILAPIAMDLYAAGSDIRLILFSHKNGSVCIRKPGTASPLPDFFRGKTFFIPHLLSIHHMLSHMFMREIGLQPGLVGQENADVFFEVVPPVQMPEFLTQHPDAAAFMVAEPIGANAVSAGSGLQLFHSREIWENHPCCAVTVQNQLIETDPDALREFTNGLVAAGEFIHQHPNRSAKIAVDFLDPEKKLGLDVPVLKKVLSDPSGIRTEDLFPSIRDLHKIRNYMSEKMGIGAPLDMEAFVDLRFAELAYRKPDVVVHPSLFRGPEKVLTRLSSAPSSPSDLKIDRYESMIIISIASNPGMIDTILPEIESFVPRTDFEILPKIRIVVQELIQNAIVHGNENNPEKLVICTLTRIGESFFKISVRDEGRHMNHNLTHEKQVPEDKISLPRIRAFSEKIECNREGNLVTAYVRQEQETRFEISDTGEWKVIRPTGKMTAATADSFRQCLQELIATGRTKYRFDFARVKDIDSVSLSVFVVFIKMAAKKDLVLDTEIVNMDEDLVSLFKMTRLDRHYRICTSEAPKR